ncbi:MAG: prepilin-type N-terminal cleavage/methylation domain-containing protein [Phycisphaerales bacterium]|nr:prepilin-type N-terminal cleavage/methylation domain-containing protein [Phycisphaerales bacterium]
MSTVPIADRPCRTALTRCGFTLIELMAVVVILGVLSVTAAVSMNGNWAARSRAAADLIARDVSFARERALATGTTNWVVFSVGSNSYSVLAENPAAPGRAGALTITDPATGQAFVSRLSDPAFAGVSVSAVSIPGGGTDLGFDWMGRPINAAGTRLTTDATITLSPPQTVTVTGGAGVVGVP